LDDIQVNDIAFDRLGNIYIVGNIRPSKAASIFSIPVIAKYDSQGSELWQQRCTHVPYAGTVAADDLGNAYVLASRGSKPEIVSTKYDPNGRRLWTANYWDAKYYRLLRETASVEEYSIAVGANRNVYVAAQGLLLKYNTLGKLLWVVPTLDEAQWESVLRIYRPITVDHAGNACVAGFAYGRDLPPDHTTAKYDPNGALLWMAKYESTETLRRTATALTVDAQGAVYATGSTIDTDNNRFATTITIKYDAHGRQQWLARYPGATPFSIALHPAGSLYVAGFTYFPKRIVTIKYDTDGNQQWAAIHPKPLMPGLIGPSYTYIGLILDEKQSVYVPGVIFDEHDWQTKWEHSNSMIIKYDATGAEAWAKPFSNVRQLAGILNEIRTETVE
jgi:hypothetical protein